MKRIRLVSGPPVSVLWKGAASSLKIAVEKAVNAGVSLGGADLRGADLRSAALWGAVLWSANLRGANLRSANLGNANLWDADLGGADLRGANLRGANLRSANLGHANLGAADLGGADLRGAHLGGGITVKASLQVGLINGWPVILFSTSQGLRVKVGCHCFSLKEAEVHWRGRPNREGLYLLVTKGWNLLVKMAGWEEGTA